MNWIAMRKDLVDDADTSRMSRALRVTLEHVVGLLLRIWAWADSNTTDGVIEGLTLDDLKAMPQWPEEFIDAMVEVGWLEGDESRVVFPGFDTYNSASAKKRLQNVKRKRKERSRNGHANVTKMSRGKRDNSVTTIQNKDNSLDANASKEKPSSKSSARKRSSKASDAIDDYPDGMDTAEVRAAVDEWADYRLDSKLKPLKPRSWKTKLEEFSTDHGDDAPRAFCHAVKHSIGNGYQGIHHPGAGGANGKAKRAASDAHRRQRGADYEYKF